MTLILAKIKAVSTFSNHPSCVVEVVMFMLLLWRRKDGRKELEA